MDEPGKIHEVSHIVPGTEISDAKVQRGLHDPPYLSQSFISRQQEASGGFWHIAQWQVRPCPQMKQRLVTVDEKSLIIYSPLLL